MGSVGVVLRVQGNLLVSILAAGLVAVLFQPVRERLQRAVNHLMYGKRDDPYAVLSHLGQRLESTLAPDDVLPAVTRTVREALKLPYAEIQLRRREGFENAAAAGDPVDDTLRLPLVYGGETVGLLVLGLRAGEESFSPEEERLFEDLAHQIGVAAHATLLGDEAIRLSADLQRSRERLVSAREEERRRLRRDLHDGLGPQLASLTMTAEAARDLVSTDPRRAEELLAGVMERAQDAVSDVRRLVYELRPPALDALGLLAALRAYADHHTAGGIRVTVESPSALPPLPAAVEVAAYRIAMEALNNVARHASARNCEVRLSLDEVASMLALEVSDDGRGIEGDYVAGRGPLLHAREGRRARWLVRDRSRTFRRYQGNGTIALRAGWCGPDRFTRGDVALEQIRVLIADDHAHFREGLRALLLSATDLEVIGEAADGREAISLAEMLQPDVILMDLGMPGVNGIEATRAILHTSPHISILVISMQEDDDSVFAALQAGARGYLLKGALKAEILRSIRAVSSGEAIFGPAIARRLMQYFSKSTPGRAARRLPRADRARARDPGAHSPPRDEPRDRQAPPSEPQDRPQPRLEHLHQAAGRRPRPGHHPRPRGRAGPGRWMKIAVTFLHASLLAGLRTPGHLVAASLDGSLQFLPGVRAQHGAVGHYDRGEPFAE